jgi:hypothetical protein
MAGPIALNTTKSRALSLLLDSFSYSVKNLVNSSASSSFFKSLT